MEDDWVARRLPPDWPLLLLVFACFLVIPWWAVLPDVLHARGRPVQASATAYADAVRRAAVRTPDDAFPLRVLQGEKVDLVRLSFQPMASGEQELEGDTWAAHPDDVLRVCRGAEDPLLRIQQLLGLPAQSGGTYRMNRIEVATGSVVRPCFGGDSVTSPTCSFKPAPALSTAAPAVGTAAGHAGQPQAAADPLLAVRVAASNVLRVWRPRAGDERAEGMPFTGMGWTWDWAPDAKSRFGVTEFVIPAGKTFTVKGSESPASFCNPG